MPLWYWVGKARGLQMEEIGCKCQMFSVSDFFPPSLYKIKRRFLLKFCVAMTLGSTWTFLKPWANQCSFLINMFFLSYVSELCIYPRLSFFKLVPTKTQNQPIRAQQTGVFYSYIVLLLYVNESIYLLGNLPFFKIHVSCFMAWDDSPGDNVISKCMLWGRAWCHSEFWDVSFL